MSTLKKTKSMKKNFLTSTMFYLLMMTIATMIFLRCNDSKAGSATKPPAKRTLIDTAKVVGMFISKDFKNVFHDVIYRVRFDSVQFDVPTGKETFRKEWGIDSAYFVPRLDTLRDSLSRKPIMDENGRAKMVTVWDAQDKRFVWDLDMDIDSAIKKFRQFLIVDTAKKNPN